MKRIIIVALILSAFIGCSSPSAQELLYQAENLSNQELYAEAVDMTYKATEKDPKFLKAYILRGINYWKLGAYEAAITDFQTVLDSEPNNITSLFYMGMVNNSLENFPEALNYFGQVFMAKSMEEQESSPSQDNQAPYYIAENEVFFQKGVTYYLMDDAWKAQKFLNIAKTEGYPANICDEWLSKVDLKIDQEMKKGEELKLKIDSMKNNSTVFSSHNNHPFIKLIH